MSSFYFPRLSVLLITIITIGFPNLASAQITAPQATSVIPTVYTNYSPNDQIYIFCTPDAADNPVTGSLTATPSGGTPGWNFVWGQYNAGTQSYNTIQTNNGVPSSTLSGLASGGYNVTITDGSGNTSCYQTWVWVIQEDVTVNPIPSGCDSVPLSGVVNGNSSFTYYDPPVAPFVVGPTTDISVCFSATHTYVSDLGFYLVGPASCGSPLLQLEQAIAVQVGNNCNSGDNINNLCFTTTSSNPFNGCTQPVPLSGTFELNEGNGAAAVYGCDAAAGGWQVQIWDCIGADVGSLTNSTITFNGNSSCGPSTVTYASGPIHQVINDNSCSYASAATYTVPFPPVAVHNLNSTSTYQWTANPPVAIPNATTSLNTLVDPAPSQDTWFYLTITDTYGCQHTDSAFFDYTPSGDPTINPAGPFCVSGNPVNLTSVEPGGTWSGNGVSSSGLFNPTVAGAGNHTITYTLPGSCGSFDTEIITVDSISFTNIVNDATCNGYSDGSISITNPTGGVSPYQFSNDNGNTFQAGFMFNGLSAGNYSLVVIDNNSCESLPVTVTVSEFPLVSFTSATTTANCGNPDGSLTLTGADGDGGPYQYSIDDGVNFQPSGTFNGLLPVTYNIVVEDNSGCTVSGTVSVPNSAGFTVNVTGSTNATCNGTCDGTADMVANPGFVGTVDYDWIDLATNLSTGQLTPNATGLCAATYLAAAIDDVGCMAADTVTITEPAIVTVTTSAAVTICIGSTTTLTATPSGGTPGYSYIWTAAPADPSLLTPTIANPTVAPVITTVYTVNVEDINNCPASPETVTVTVNPPLTLTMLPPGPIDICPGETATMDMTATGGDGNYVFTWDGGSNPLNPPVAVTPSSNTTYNFIVNDGCGTSPATQSVDVNIFLLPVIDFAANIYSGCQPLRVTFNDNTQPQPANLFWNFGDPDSGTNNTSSGTTPTHAYNDPGSYDVSLVVTTPDGCKDSLTMQNMIIVYALPVAEFEAIPPSTDILHPEIIFNNNSSSVPQWLWDFGDDSTSIIENPVHWYGDTGIYTVWLWIETADGCKDSTYNFVEITPVFTFYVPSAFTPNSDGVNDTFFPKGETIDPNNYVFRVFNRWGQEIFASHTPGEKWNGTLPTGLYAQEDVYVWVAEMRDTNGEKHKFYGRVTLYR